MPNIFKSLLVRRFLAHSLELGTTFAVSIILIQILIYVNNFIFSNGDFITILNSNTPSAGVLNNENFAQQSINSIYQLIIAFALFYFVYTAFNFFFTFSFLYPKNDFQANFFQRQFGFKKYDFGKKKLSHLQKALKMLLRELILFLSIYGFFGLLAIFKVKDFFEMFYFITQAESTIQNIFLSLVALFVIFVAPALALSLFSLKISKGKQFFWDYLSSVTLK